MSKRRKQFSEINVVPYIDVMLVLLVIFMVTVPLMHQSIQINLPKTEGQAIDTTASTPIILSVDKIGQLYLNFVDEPQRPLKPDELMVYVAAKLAYAHQKKVPLPVFVRGDGGSSYQHVMQAVSLLSKSGAKGIGLMTEPTQG